jgi:AcrR family transcriptional regulator
MIIAAASDHINHRGVKGMTLADVAASVGLITTSVTYYFKKKEDLAEACLQDAIQRLDELISRALELETTEARLDTFLGLWLQLDRRIRQGEAPPLAGLSDIRALTDPHRARVMAAFVALFGKVRALFHHPDFEGISHREATARAYVLMEQIFWSVAWLPRYDPEDYPRVRERMLDILLHGLMGDGQIWDPEATEPVVEDETALDARASDAFLIAATRLINRFGYRGVSVERISAELNVTKGCFYHHNEAKDDLVVSCFQRTFAVARQVQTAALAGPGTAWDKLVAICGALVRFQVSEHGPLLRSSALSALPEPIRLRMVEQSNRLSERFAGLIADGIAEGVMRPVDPMIASQMLKATLNASADLRDSPADITQSTVGELYSRPILTGLCAPYIKPGI